MNRFCDRVACVVGAAGGMGLACAQALAREGARVALCDRDADGLRRAAETIPGAPIFELDVRDGSASGAALGAAEAALGPLDHLVVASGIFRAAPLLDTPADTWADLFAVNVFGPVALMRAAGARLRERRAGSIVVVASQSARVVRVRQSAYGASKAALTYAAKALALELAPHGVRVNVVQPGVTDTPMARSVWEQGRGSREQHVAGSLENYRPPIPLGKVARPEDVAAAVLFLLSDDAGHITMSELLVDGGGSLLA
jgi:2,3-dihydro-2,3-dihydroxybenzoate dehydrogenase